jgi:WD40 repeat protein
MHRFAAWDPERDAATFTVPGRAEGVGWAGAGILVGWSHRAGGVAFVDTSRGEWYRNEPRLDLHGRLWPGRSGEITYSSSPEGDIVLVDPTTGRPTGDVVPVGGDVASMSESPDATQIATASWNDGWKVRVHDLATGEVVADGLEGPQIVAFAPDGTLYAAHHGRITRHDPSDLRPLGTLPGAHGEVNSLQFSQDGSLLLATANDETATLYDLATGLRLGEPVRTAAPLIVPAWLRPDGEELAVTVTEGVAMWDLDPSRQFAAVCRLAGRELTPEEWATYFGTDSRQAATCAGVLG